MRGYRYYNAAFQVVHVTSLPQSHREAIKYFRMINRRWKIKAVYVECRPAGERKFVMLPIKFENGVLSHV